MVQFDLVDHFHEFIKTHIPQVIKMLSIKVVQHQLTFWWQLSDTWLLFMYYRLWR